MFKVTEAEKRMYLDDYLQKKYGHEGLMMLLLAIGLPFLVLIFLGFEHYVAAVQPASDRALLEIGFLLPIVFIAMVPAFAIVFLLYHLWERRRQRMEAKEAQE
ncbi:MAG: hypothetical protein WD940_01895 [Patescibacteria group bacterium]